MLTSFNIRNIVLIDALTIEFGTGLNVLTGETGAGKSILLDALGLVTGARADMGLIRKGEDQATISAIIEGDIPADICADLADAGVEIDGDLIVRRAITRTGKSRALVNDQPVGLALLQNVVRPLVEIHGQNDDAGLLAPAGHRALLDMFGNLDKDVAATRAAFQIWADARAALKQAGADIAAARADEEFLRHATDELIALGPEAGEEELLANRRRALQNAERIAEDVDAVRSSLAGGDQGAENILTTALRRLQSVADKSGGILDDTLEALDRALNETSEASARVDAAARELITDPAELDQVEERLFALRACARKHGVQVDGLADLQKRFEVQLASIDQGGADIAVLTRKVRDAEQKYDKCAAGLSKKRAAASGKLDKAVMGELEPLGLGKAVFQAGISQLGEPTAHGRDRVEFRIATNPGSAMGPLTRVASGGEMARLVLALKVVLAAAKAVPTMVFDEVDRGIGGATADMVGERLKRLSKNGQVLVITHSPQVAAKGDTHFRIEKKETVPGLTATQVALLQADDRREEIARMLAGAKVTDAARDAATDLIGAG